MKLEIVTPAGTAYAADVEMVTLPAVDGDIGEGDTDEVLAVGEGLVAITADHVAIVTDMAIAAKDIDEAKVEEARQRALARLQDKISDEEVRRRP